MRKVRIVTAALLSAGLILSTATTAFSVNSKPLGTVTASTYKSHLAAYKSGLIAFAGATAIFKVQVAKYAAAFQKYTRSTTDSLNAYTEVLKTNSSAPSAVQYALEVSAYKIAVTAYNTNTAVNKSALKVLQVAATNYDVLYRVIQRSYQVVLQLREQLKLTTNPAFAVSVHRANITFAASMAAATSAEQKNAATNLHHAAINTAVVSRKDAIVAQGLKIVKPVKSAAGASNQGYGFKATRPVRPATPVKLSVD